MILIRASIISILLCSLYACTDVCTDAGIEGSYELTSRGVSYTLYLKSRGDGTLEKMGKTIGALHWKLATASNQQILELDASGDVHAALLGIDDTAKRTTGTISVTGGISL
jgi:hypothetical protein